MPYVMTGHAGLDPGSYPLLGGLRHRRHGSSPGRGAAIGSRALAVAWPRGGRTPVPVPRVLLPHPTALPWGGPRRRSARRGSPRRSAAALVARPLARGARERPHARLRLCRRSGRGRRDLELPHARSPLGRDDVGAATQSHAAGRRAAAPCLPRPVALHGDAGLAGALLPAAGLRIADEREILDQPSALRTQGRWGHPRTTRAPHTHGLPPGARAGGPRLEGQGRDEHRLGPDRATPLRGIRSSVGNQAARSPLLPAYRGRAHRASAVGRGRRVDPCAQDRLRPRVRGPQPGPPDDLDRRRGRREARAVLPRLRWAGGSLEAQVDRRAARAREPDRLP